MTVLTPAEFALLDAEMSAAHKVFVRLLVGTGLRFGEATGLEVRHLALGGKEQSVRVAQAWQRQDDNSFILAPPKTVRSRRTVTIGPDLARQLGALVDGRAPEQLVFATKRGAPIRHNNFAQRVWKPALERAVKVGLGKQPRIHDLRHTHASWLLADGTPINVVQRRLGHSSITTTVDRYGHLMPGADYAAAKSADALLPRG